MNEMPLTYGPGDSTAVVLGAVGVLLRWDPRSEVTRRVLQVLDAGGAVDEVLEVLISGGFRSLADFGIFERRPDGIRLVVRGGYIGNVDGGPPITAQHTTWHDSWHEGSTHVSVQDSDHADVGDLPLYGGVVLASSLSAGPLPLSGAEVEPDLRSLVSDTSQVAALPSVAPEPPTVLAASEPSPGEVPTREPSAVPAQSESDEVVTGDDFDHLFATQMRPVPPPDAVPEPSPDSHRRAAETMVAPMMVPESGDAAVASPVVQPSGSGPMITAMPWSVAGPQVAEPAGPPDLASAGDLAFALAPPRANPAVEREVAEPAPPGKEPTLTDVTINRSMLVGQGPAAVTVVAARCPHGHLSPAYAGICRVCRAPIPAQQPLEIPRPRLGLLRLSTGGVVPLDRAVILGRNPKVPSNFRGEQPNLVQISDPEKDVSGQHLEVSLDYWNVMVRDLGSTNGTEVVLPGQMPFALRPNDPVIIEPGTRVVLAGTVSFVFEVSE